MRIRFSGAVSMLFLVTAIGGMSFVLIYILWITGDVSLNAVFCSLLEHGFSQLPESCDVRVAR